MATTPRLLPTAKIRTELIELFHGLGSDLAKWLHGQFLRHGGKNWWRHHVCEVVQERDQQRIADGEWKELADMDLGSLLGLLQANFRFLKSRRALDKEARDTIRAMKEVRNRCEGHWPVKGIPLTEFAVHLAAIRAFSGLIGGGKARAEQIDAAERSLEALKERGDDDVVEESQPKEDAQPPFILTPEKRLADYFGDEALTPSQQRAVDELQRFLDSSDEHCFILRGYAGTGKTFLIGGLVRYLQAVHRKPEMMAPRARAAHVLRDRHQVDASTVHRHIYSLAALKEYREVDENGDVTYKFYFELKNNDLEHDTVFIVDEASMLSDVYSESEFMHFGSGRLLSDLLRYINFDANDYRKKLILVGDDAQLPPVGMNKSPALDAEYLRKKCFIRSNGCELTDVVRQVDSSPVLENATKMRELLRTQRFPSFDFVSDGKAIRELRPDEFVETFVRERDPSSINRSVIVADTNAKTKDYNDAVRSRLFPGSASIVPGDQIIVVRNNYRYERALLNGQMGLIVDCADQTEVRKVPLNVPDETGKRKIEMIKLEFREAKLRFPHDREGHFDITCKISEDCLQNRDADISSNYSKALYVDFKERHPDLKPGQPEFKEALKSDPYFNAVMLKYGYAITCHKAQGGEWVTVFVDFSGKNKLNADGIRWSYTALTRAETSVVATNALHHTILTPKKGLVRPFKVETPSAPSTDASTSIQAHGSTETMKSSDAVNPGAAIKSLVEALLPEGWKIVGTRSHQYQERVILGVAEKQITVAVHYKSNHRVSRVQIMPKNGQDELDQQASNILAPLKGQTLVPDGSASSNVRESHAAFVKALEEKFSPRGVEVVFLKSNTEYHLVTRLRAGMAEGTVNYHFDGKGTLSSCLPHSDCPDTIIEILQGIHPIHG
ncbi:AAA family ATPase [Akkermansiaceae bacterium]|nr:AAA family ATPase [Akkermansiaceae bacterium]